MVNKEKAVKRELVRLRKTQNPQQIDFRRIRQLRKARTKFWATKTVGGSKTVETVEDKKPEKKKKKAPKKKEKEPELEVIDGEPELEVIDEEPEPEVVDKELEELYSYDEEIVDDEEEEAEESE